MKIEFKKVPQIEKDFSFSKDSVEFSGTFCRISQRLVKLESKIAGTCEVDCYKCGKTFDIEVDEDLTFILSDGIFDSENEKEDEIIIEIDNHIIDFELILDSELESLRSDYYVCDDCEEDTVVELEY
jgi:hypothetical protein